MQLLFYRFSFFLGNATWCIQCVFCLWHFNMNEDSFFFGRNCKKIEVSVVWKTVKWRLKFNQLWCYESRISLSIRSNTVSAEPAILAVYNGYNRRFNQKSRNLYTKHAPMIKKGLPMPRNKYQLWMSNAVNKVFSIRSQWCFKILTHFISSLKLMCKYMCH